MNGDDAPHVGGGRDAVLGRHGPQNDLPATAISIVDPAGAVHHLPQTTEFITARGGGYFFAPSISGISALTQEVAVA